MVTCQFLCYNEIHIEIALNHYVFLALIWKIQKFLFHFHKSFRNMVRGLGLQEQGLNSGRGGKNFQMYFQIFI